MGRPWVGSIVQRLARVLSNVIVRPMAGSVPRARAQARCVAPGPWQASQPTDSSDQVVAKVSVAAS